MKYSPHHRFIRIVESHSPNACRGWQMALMALLLSCTACTLYSPLFRKSSSSRWWARRGLLLSHWHLRASYLPRQAPSWQGLRPIRFLILPQFCRYDLASCSSSYLVSVAKRRRLWIDSAPSSRSCNFWGYWRNAVPDIGTDPFGTDACRSWWCARSRIGR